MELTIACARATMLHDMYFKIKYYLELLRMFWKIPSMLNMTVINKNFVTFAFIIVVSKYVGSLYEANV